MTPRCGGAPASGAPSNGRASIRTSPPTPSSDPPSRVGARRTGNRQRGPGRGGTGCSRTVHGVRRGATEEEVQLRVRAVRLLGVFEPGPIRGQVAGLAAIGPG